MDVPGPFRSVEGGSYTLEGRFKTGMATKRRSMKLSHDTLAKFFYCWDKNLVAEEKQPVAGREKTWVLLSSCASLDHLFAFCSVIKN